MENNRQINGGLIKVHLKLRSGVKDVAKFGFLLGGKDIVVLGVERRDVVPLCTLENTIGEQSGHGRKDITKERKKEGKLDIGKSLKIRPSKFAFMGEPIN